MKEYTQSFRFANTEKDAQMFCAEEDKYKSKYLKKKYPSHYTPWSDGKKNIFVVWY